MCGIAGTYDIGHQTMADGRFIHRMCDSIVHRGPDDSGIYLDRWFGMGMRRLAIIDRAGGKQPLANEDASVWVVFNGEIYNHAELRQDLQRKGHVFQTTSDTEVLVHLYEEESIDCLDRLRGMFSFAIWDVKQQRLFIARDRLGIKPCFWSLVAKRFAFASEIKSLLQLKWVDQEIDWNGFDAFFTYGYIPAPLTIYKQIHKLPPAHYLLASPEGIQIKRYWDLSFANKFTADEQEIGERFLHEFKESVAMRLMSEVPLGAFLSGGVDSGMVVAIMAQSLSQSPETFTIRFGGNQGSFLDETPFARKVAQQYRCHHHEIVVQPAIENALAAAMYAFDEPFADDSIIPTYHICKEAGKRVTVILTGLGGDENFAGYERYLGFWLSGFYKRVPAWIRQGVVRPLVSSLRESAGGGYRVNHLKRFIEASGLPAGVRYGRYQQALDEKQRRALYLDDIAREIDFSYVDSLGWEHFDRLEEGDIIDRMLYQDLNMYLPEDILALSDRMGMHHSLELRVPFVDHQLVEFCARIPSQLKMRLGQKKYMLRQVGRTLLPDSVVDHRKQGFCAPMASWLRNDLKKMVDYELSGERLEKKQIFQPAVVNRIVRNHYARRELNDKVIFSLLVFNQWFNNHESGVEG